MMDTNMTDKQESEECIENGLMKCVTDPGENVQKTINILPS